MINNFMHMFVKDYLLPSQHGFIPGRGTLSAWKEIMTKVIDKPYIYECDLKQFFPSVNVSKLGKLLETDLKVPLTVSTGLFELNSSLPVLPKDVKLDENYTLNTKEKLRNLKEEQNWDWAEDVPDKYYNSSSAGGFKMNSTGAVDFWENPIGVPQGAPTSPLISILILVKSFLTQTSSVSYADDPIFYGDQPFEIEEFPDLGVVLNKDKSSWVKKANTWLGDLNYLGLKYSPSEDSLSGNTRKGSTLKLSPEFRDKIIKKFLPGKPLSWVTFFRLKDIGMIFSRLYIGSWKSNAITQDFTLFPEENSWVWMQWSHEGGRPRSRYSVFNVSSFACQSLCKKLTKIRRLKAPLQPAKKMKTITITIPNLFGTPRITSPIEFITNSLSNISHTTRSLYIEFNRIVETRNPKELLRVCDETVQLISTELKDFTQTFIEISRNYNPSKPQTTVPCSHVLVKPQKESLIYARISSQFKNLETQLELTYAIYNMVLKRKDSISTLKQAMIKTLINATDSIKIQHTSSSIHDQPWTDPADIRTFPITFNSTKSYKYAVYHYKKIRLTLLAITEEYKKTLTLLASEQYSNPTNVDNDNLIQEPPKKIGCSKPKVKLPTCIQIRNNLIKFISSFLITLFLLDKLGRRFLPPLTTYIDGIDHTNCWTWEDIIGWILISFALFLLLGIWCWYVGIIDNPITPSSPPPNPLLKDFSNHIETLNKANQSLSDQVTALAETNEELTKINLVSKLNTESLSAKLDTVNSRLEYFEKLNALVQGRLESIKQTLLVVRQENLNLNSQLASKFAEFERTNNLLDITRAELDKVSDRLDELMFTLDATDHGVGRLADGFNTLFVECPAIQMLHQVGQFTNLDITAARMITSQLQNGDEVLVFASDSVSMNIINGLHIIRDFMVDHPDVSSISELVSYW
jgi:hypothetical protein